MKAKRKLVLATFALLVVVLLAGAYVQFFAKSFEPEPIKRIGLPTLTGQEIRNPEIAPKYGIKGYIDISVTPDTPMTLAIAKGREASITILLHFVSHVPDVKEIQVTLGPDSGEGLTIEQCYVVTDGNGKVVGEGIININRLVRYNPSGVVKIRSGETLPVTMTIRIPVDFPRGVDPFPLGAVGITANVPILDETRMMVYA